jgi:hypothetical protein
MPWVGWYRLSGSAQWQKSVEADTADACAITCRRSRPASVLPAIGR